MTRRRRRSRNHLPPLRKPWKPASTDVFRHLGLDTGVIAGKTAANPRDSTNEGGDDHAHPLPRLPAAARFLGALARPWRDHPATNVTFVTFRQRYSKTWCLTFPLVTRTGGSSDGHPTLRQFRKPASGQTLRRKADAPAAGPAHLAPPANGAENRPRSPNADSGSAERTGWDVSVADLNSTSLPSPWRAIAPRIAGAPTRKLQ